MGKFFSDGVTGFPTGPLPLSHLWKGVVQDTFNPTSQEQSGDLSGPFQAEAAHRKRRVQVGSALRISLICQDALVYHSYNFRVKYLRRSWRRYYFYFRNEGAWLPGWKEAPCWSSWGLNWSALDIWTFSVRYIEEPFVMTMGDAVKHDSGRGRGQQNRNFWQPRLKQFLLVKYSWKEEGAAKPFGSVWRAAIRWVDGKDRDQSCFHVTDLTVFEEGRQPPELTQYLRRWIGTSAIRTGSLILSTYVCQSCSLISKLESAFNIVLFLTGNSPSARFSAWQNCFNDRRRNSAHIVDWHR